MNKKNVLCLISFLMSNVFYASESPSFQGVIDELSLQNEGLQLLIEANLFYVKSTSLEREYVEIVKKISKNTDKDDEFLTLVQEFDNVHLQLKNMQAAANVLSERQKNFQMRVAAAIAERSK